jgi:hypothetical protein
MTRSTNVVVAVSRWNFTYQIVGFWKFAVSSLVGLLET